MSLFAAVVTLLSPTPAAELPQGCEHTHGRVVAVGAVRHHLRHHRPTVRRDRVRHFVRCTSNRRARRAARLAERRGWAWRREYAHVWPIRLARMPAGWVGWAQNITACESGWNRYASNGTHHSYFQWAPSTWASAVGRFGGGYPASPYDATWPHQAVVAIKWAWYAGTSQWACRG